MSSFALNRNYQLQLPNVFVDVEREEFEYVDGGGRITLHFCGATVAGLAAGGTSSAAIGLALAGIDAEIGGAIILGTGGTGTLVAAAIMSMVGVAIPAIAGSIASCVEAASVRGYSYTFDDHWFTPTATIDL